MPLGTGPWRCAPPPPWAPAGLPPATPPAPPPHSTQHAAGRTVVSRQEGGLVDVVSDVERLAVEGGRRGDLAVAGVDAQPVCRV